MGMTRAFHAGSLEHDASSETPANTGESRGAGDTLGTQIAHTGHEIPANVGSEPGTTLPSSSGLGRQPFTLDTAVRICSGVLTKTCPKCSEELPLDAFNRATARRDGRQNICRECYRTKIHRDPAHVAKARERSKAYTKANPEKRRAHRKLEWAIESGKMIRGFCECCGTEKADAHHWKGYDHPLDVQWLCRSCHVTLEPRRGAA